MKKSNNDISIDQLNAACSHYFELRSLGMTKNIAIRQIVKMVDIYAKMRVIGKCSVDKANEFSHWSIEAIKTWKEAKSKNSKASYGTFLRVEHGTPRTQFTEIVLSKYYEKKFLTVETLEKLINEKWKVAVITLNEDKRLDRTNKQNLTPNQRWKNAGIKFPDGSKPNSITNPDIRKQNSLKEISASKNESEKIIEVPNITGRDYKIYLEALYVSLPMMLRHSLSASNIFDLMRILESQKGKSILDGNELRSEIFKLIKELEEDYRANGHRKPKSGESVIDSLVKKYLNNLEKYTPRGYNTAYLDWKNSGFKNLL